MSTFVNWLIGKLIINGCQFPLFCDLVCAVHMKGFCNVQLIDVVPPFSYLHSCNFNYHVQTDFPHRHKHIYLNPHTKKAEKALIAASIVQEIHSMNPPGRFLKEVPIEGGGGDTTATATANKDNNKNKKEKKQCCWVEISNDRACLKTGQALRECGPEIRQKIVDLSLGVGSAVVNGVSPSKALGLGSRSSPSSTVPKANSPTTASPTKQQQQQDNTSYSLMGAASFGGKKRQLPMKKRKSIHLDGGSDNEPVTKSSNNDDNCESAKPLQHLISAEMLEGGGSEKLLPQLNDVLINNSALIPSASIFHHVGNRRFRVLVEVNLSNYFGELLSELSNLEHWMAWMSQESIVQTKRQDEVVTSVIGSVLGNNPPGKFLIQIATDNNTSGGSNSSNMNGGYGTSKQPTSTTTDDVEKELLELDWKLATQEEIMSKVHTTFLAAGRFHVKQHFTMLLAEQEMQQRQAIVQAIGQQQQQQQQVNIQARAASALDVMMEANRINALLNQGSGSNSSLSSHNNKAIPSYRPSSKKNWGARSASQSLNYPTLNIDAGMTSTNNEGLNSTPSATAMVSNSRGSDDSTTFSNKKDTAAPYPCPAKLRVFLTLPMERFFVEEDHNISPYSDPVPPTINSSSTIIPSNYDVLCGPDRQSFFHHIGNRRFRVMIEMNVQRYEKAYLTSVSNAARHATSSNTIGEHHVQNVINEMGEDYIQKLIGEILLALSRADPPGRFLGMDMKTGKWRVLNPVYANLKTELTFFECLQVQQRRLSNILLEEERNCRIAKEQEALIAAELEIRRRSVDQTGPSADNSCPKGVCPSTAAIRNCLPFLAAANQGMDLQSLQDQAKNDLKKQQQQHQQQQHQASPSRPQNSSAGDSKTLNEMAMTDIVQRFASEQSDKSRALLHQIQRTASITHSNCHELPKPQQRRSSLPVTLPSSSSSQVKNDGNMSSNQMPKRDSAVSTDSNDSTESQYSSSSEGDSDKMKGLLDVVGTMMMMARRGSC